jgi:hypothetical protein
MNNPSKLSPQQRAINFAQATRKYEQQLPSAKYVENSTLQFQLPKARFLSKITLLVKGTFKATDGTKTAITKAVFDKYNLIRRVRLSINNGFNPYDISGQMLSMYNKIAMFNKPASDVFGLDSLGVVVSSGGTVNKVSFAMELPITLNDRDPIGLIMLQNDQSIVTLNVDTSPIEKIMTDDDIVLSDVDITITPVVETFSIPNFADAIPDYSVVKLVNEQSENIVGTNEMVIKLPVGMTYRKVGFYLASDTVYTPIASDKISGFQLVFNQADSPINVPAEYIAYKNKNAYDGALPLGAYVLDFSEQGIANYGGGRDYVDTERLQEAWVKVLFKDLTGSSNYVYTFAEKLAKLR